MNEKLSSDLFLPLKRKKRENGAKKGSEVIGGKAVQRGKKRNKNGVKGNHESTRGSARGHRARTEERY